MKKKDLDTLRKLLEDEKRKLVKHLDELSNKAVEDLESPSGDSVDIASLEINQAAMQKIGKREVYLLKKIDLALSKMDEGTFGECESCGEEIALARLMARPVAQLCIDCKTEQENVERRYSSREEAEDGDGFPEDSDEA
jgi:DnaK suppressor protein